MRRIRFVLAATAVLAASAATAAEFRFQHHYIDRDLPIYQGWIGDYGQTALVDVDRDGKLDFILGRQGKPATIYWFRQEGAGRWARHVLGQDSMSSVGAVALDVDRDGWTDLVTSGAWYRNPQNPREREFIRRVFDPQGGDAHDVIAADVDGDGRPDVLTHGQGKNGLCWYRIPADPNGPWEKHSISKGIHGAIAPAGTGDLDGDGDLDVVRADTWYENADGKGLRWVAHPNVPVGRAGPYGVCVRTVVADIDGDGRAELIVADCDIVGSQVAVLKNVDGKGGQWAKQMLPQSFVYGSLHSLAVADFDADGKPDVFVAEQEELLPKGRENPRFVIWRNLGQGRFAEQIIFDGKLGSHEAVVGDVDGDGDLDICSKAWGPLPWNANGGKMHVDWLENLLRSPGAAKPR